MSVPGVGGAHDEGFVSATGNISRSGRVRKKNSLLAGYESLDVIEKPKKKGEKSPKIKEKNNASPKVTLKVGGETPKKTPKRPPAKRPKMGIPEAKAKMDMKSRMAAMGMMEDDDDDEGELEIDLPPEFEEEIPLIAAEEIIDETLLDEEDGATEIAEHTSINKLKSQAESTYMMEKTLEKIRKNANQPNAVPGKAKNARKDKGNPRITAYMLWAKDQRATFANKYPHLDFSAVSKKLGELWATVPQNQKKMWKNRAAKLMRKNAHVTENMKNSGVSPGPANNVKTTSKKMTTPTKAKIIKTTGKDPVRKDSSPITPKSPAKAKGGGGSAKKVNATPGKGAKIENGNRKKSSPPTKGASRGKSKPGSATASSSSSAINFSSEFTHQTTVHIKSDKKSQSKSVANHTSISTLNTVNVSTIQAVTSRSSPGSPSSKTQYSPRKDDDVALYKVTGTSPIDVGAHFSLLGESLSIIGERLKDVEGQTVSGSLSVLLDSLLCATGPLLCLTQQVPELNSIPPDDLAKLLDNIAYVMPGL